MIDGGNPVFFCLQFSTGPNAKHGSLEFLEQCICSLKSLVENNYQPIASRAPSVDEDLAAGTGRSLPKSCV